VRTLAGAFAVAAGLAAAAEPPAFWHAQVDNDVAFHTDRWYTSGVRIYRSSPLAPDAPLAHWLRAPSAGAQRFDLGIVQEITTGDGKADPSAADRPNAARLLLSAMRHDAGPGLLATLGVEAGVSGPSALGEQAQELFHRLFPAPETDWSKQVGDRADLNLVGAWSQRVGPEAFPGALVLHGGGTLGTLVTFAHVGAEWRSHGPARTASPLLRFAPTPPLSRGERGFTWFAGASLRVVARNRLFERKPDDPVPEVAAERRVGRIAGGVGWAGDWGVLTFTLAQDTREFDGQSAPHRFGALTYAAAFE